MADIEVENILREIRERVYAEQEASATAQSSGVNVDDTSRENDESKLVGNLPRLDSYLTTTARAWDRLPPVVSNRSGTTARIELWLKRHLKRATRWYAWEQVNFNAAVHHALRDIVELLTQLRAETEARAAEHQQYRSEMRRLRSEFEAQERLVMSLDAQLAETIIELREGITNLQQEHRVSYKQLALETSEAGVIQDRARRKTEALLEQLLRRVDELEK